MVVREESLPGRTIEDGLKAKEQKNNIKKLEQSFDDLQVILDQPDGHTKIVAALESNVTLQKYMKDHKILVGKNDGGEDALIKEGNKNFFQAERGSLAGTTVAENTLGEMKSYMITEEKKDLAYIKDPEKYMKNNPGEKPSGEKDPVITNNTETTGEEAEVVANTETGAEGAVSNKIEAAAAVGVSVENKGVYAKVGGEKMGIMDGIKRGANQVVDFFKSDTGKDILGLLSLLGFADINLDSLDRRANGLPPLSEDEKTNKKTIDALKKLPLLVPTMPQGITLDPPDQKLKRHEDQLYDVTTDGSMSTIPNNQVKGSDGLMYTIDGTGKATKVEAVTIKTEEQKQQELVAELAKAPALKDVQSLPQGVVAPLLEKIKVHDGKLYDNTDATKPVLIADNEVSVDGVKYKIVQDKADTKKRTAEKVPEVPTDKQDKNVLEAIAKFNEPTEKVTIQGQEVTFTKGTDNNYTGSYFDRATMKQTKITTSTKTADGKAKREYTPAINDAVNHTEKLKGLMDTADKVASLPVKPSSFADDTFWNAFTKQVETNQDKTEAGAFKLGESSKVKERGMALVTGLKAEKAKNPSLEALNGLTIPPDLTVVEKVTVDDKGLVLHYKDTAEVVQNFPISQKQAAVLKPAATTPTTATTS